MAEYLELVMPIVDDSNQATPYFEDYLFQIIQGLGGEGSTVIETAVINAESAARVTWLNGYINRLAKRVESLESDLTKYKIAHQVAQLQIDTAGYITKTKNVAYTAKHNEWIELSSGGSITLPATPLKNHRVRVTNADSATKTIGASSSELIKNRGALTSSVSINTPGNSYDFQWFGEYWLVS